MTPNGKPVSEADILAMCREVDSVETPEDEEELEPSPWDEPEPRIDHDARDESRIQDEISRRDGFVSRCED